MWVRTWPPKKLQPRDSSVKKIAESKICSWAPSRRKWMRRRREIGAGKRNATSASLKVKPGFSEGTSQVNSAIRTKAKAPKTLSSGNSSADESVKDAAVAEPDEVEGRPEPPKGREKIK